MVQTQGSSLQVARDSISSEPSTQPIIKLKFETLNVEEASMQITSSTVGNSWIVGSSTNGLVGTNTATQGGGQQVVGESGRSNTYTKAINTNNTYIERFLFTNYKDTGTTTATWSGDGTIGMSAGQVAQSLAVYQDVTTVINATLTLDNTTGVSATYLSADAGSHWETVTSGTNHVFTDTGTDLRFKIVANGAATLNNIKIKYNV